MYQTKRRDLVLKRVGKAQTAVALSQHAAQLLHQGPPIDQPINLLHARAVVLFI